MTQPVIYLDNNATTAVAPECLEAMSECLRAGPLNPSSRHSIGQQAKARVTHAREQLAQLLGAHAAELVFTSCGTESNHLAILGALALQKDRGRSQVITSEVEHPSTLMLLRSLESQGAHVTYLPVDSAGNLILEALEDTLTEATALVSLMWANNETGVLFPIAEAAEKAKARGALFHTDAVQAVGRLPIDLARTPVDLLSLSGHKLHAPPGIGALFVRKGLRIPPQLFGHQERGRRGGTENVPGAVALGVAGVLAREHLGRDIVDQQALLDRLETGVLARVPYAIINGAGAARLPNTSNIRFGEVDAEIVIEHLDKHGICASPGAACASGTSRPSHVLTAMGLSSAAALASIRFSLGRDNTGEDIDRLLQVLPQILDELADRYNLGPALPTR